jgi:protein ImuA
MDAQKKETISQLRKEIMLMQGFKPLSAGTNDTFGLGPIEAAFPGGVFPTGALHEFICEKPEHDAASGGFIAGILSKVMSGGRACLWISRIRTVFPPALKVFGVTPDRIIFASLPSEKDVLWAMEEALKCEGLAAVACELSEISFTQSRRLALAVEQSKVTGFIVISDSRRIEATASAARWRVKPLPSMLEEGMPGVGFPRWQVELLKVRNGEPGTFQLGWKKGNFVHGSQENIPELVLKQRKAG